MKDLNEMTIEELIKETEVQRQIESDAYSRANNAEATAVSKFLRENKLNDVVVHNKTGKQGKLFTHREMTRGIRVEFYPLKKDGEVGANKSLDCTEWVSYRNLEENFKVMLNSYTPVNEETKG